MGAMNLFVTLLETNSENSENQGLEDKMSFGARPTFRSVCCLFRGGYPCTTKETLGSIGVFGIYFIKQHSGDNKQPPEGVPVTRLQS